MKDWSCYVPDAAVSHFRCLDENGIKDVHEELFVERYFTKEKRDGYSEREEARNGKPIFLLWSRSAL